MADVKGVPAALSTPSMSPLLDYKQGLVIKVVEFTGCSINEAKVALFDASNDVDAAISHIFLNMPQSCRSRSPKLTTIENKETLKKPLNSIIEQAAVKNEIKKENKLGSTDEDVQILYYSPPKIPKSSKSRSPLPADVPSTSSVSSSSATLSQLPNANAQPSLLEPKTQERYREDFMLDRIIQDYFRQNDNALPLPDYFSPDWNRDYRAQSPKNGLKRGGKPYFQPIGCMRYSVKVLGKYSPNDEWLGVKGQPSDKEWPVAYHGTKDVNVLDILVNDPRTALAYSNNYDFQGKKFQLILQCRVNPQLIQIVANGHVPGHGEYWLISDATAIRPYAILCLTTKE
uniref:UBA domain-containing protein n=1 Tax=Ditylenchus dipsaci TaxID=166011 RepID=A0A915DKV6_9BILA